MIICHFSKYVELFALLGLTAEEVANCLVLLICHHGVPEAALSDSGINLQAKLMDQLFELLDTKCHGTNKTSSNATNRNVRQADYIAGDRVWLLNEAKKKRVSKKLRRRWTGSSDNNYRIRSDSKGKRKLVHVNRLKKCNSPSKGNRYDSVIEKTSNPSEVTALTHYENSTSINAALAEQTFEGLQSPSTSGDVSHVEGGAIYGEGLQQLQGQYDPQLVAQYYPKEPTARVTCSKNKSKISPVEPKNSSLLDIKNDQKTILINGEQEMFLRFDNEDKNKNRILLFISSTGIEILQKAEEYHLDGTFKIAAQQFYQILTVHAVIDKTTYVCAYIFLENKSTLTYIIALEQLRNICFPKNLKKVMVDFESALMKSIISVFPDVTLKGCWFHFTKAIRKKICLLGLKIIYSNDYKFRFWVKRFMALALIPIDKIKDATMNSSNDDIQIIGEENSCENSIIYPDDENQPSGAECLARCKEFAEITGTDTALAMFYLQDTKWNLQKGLDKYFKATNNKKAKIVACFDVETLDNDE
ncbi:hypothetical protein BpHYR1_021018, partial [Brachionus plicatilis]